MKLILIHQMILNLLKMLTLLMLKKHIVTQIQIMKHMRMKHLRKYLRKHLWKLRS